MEKHGFHIISVVTDKEKGQVLKLFNLFYISKHLNIPCLPEIVHDGSALASVVVLLYVSLLCLYSQRKLHPPQ